MSAILNSAGELSPKVLAAAANGAQAPVGTGQAPEMNLRVLAQYVKDLSFENPGAPMSLSQGQSQPEVRVNIDVQSRDVQVDENGQGTYECQIHIQSSAQRGQDALFIVELVYGGLFGLSGVPKDALRPIMMIEAPRLLFPFARQIVADMTRNGGFVPLMLEPIDFAALYRQQIARAAQQQAGGSEPAPSA